MGLLLDGELGCASAILSSLIRLPLPSKPFVKRDILLAAESIYRELHGHEDGSVPATFQVIYLVSRRLSQHLFRSLMSPCNECLDRLEASADAAESAPSW